MEELFNSLPLCHRTGEKCLLICLQRKKLLMGTQNNFPTMGNSHFRGIATWPLNLSLMLRHHP